MNLSCLRKYQGYTDGYGAAHELLFWGIEVPKWMGRVFSWALPPRGWSWQRGCVFQRPRLGESLLQICFLNAFTLDYLYIMLHVRKQSHLQKKHKIKQSIDQLHSSKGDLCHSKKCCDLRNSLMYATFFLMFIFLLSKKLILMIEFHVVCYPLPH